MRLRSRASHCFAMPFGRGAQLLGVVVAVALIACVSGTAPASAATQLGSVTYSADSTWGVAGSPYVVAGTVGVAAGATLTIQPGVVVKFSGYGSGMSVSGTLHAVGTTADPIVFTSFQDDSAAGDTNADGAATSGAAGQWYSVAFPDAGSGTLSYVQVPDGGW